MILKVWDDESGSWIYFDRMERVSIKGRNPLKDGEDVSYAGIYTNLKESFNVATIKRTWGHRTEGECIAIAFLEGYLLGDDGQTIERL